MSQKEGKFQSKSRFGGGKDKGGFKGRGKPGGGGFSKRFEGDRNSGSSSGGDRPKRFGGKPKEFGGQPRRFEQRDGGSASGDKPYVKREYKPREDRGSDRPYQKREFKPREDRGGGSDRPYVKREYKPREDRGGGGDRPYQKREFKPREDRGAGSDRPYVKREYKPREDRGGGGDRPYQKREFKPREDRGGGSDRPYVKREFKPREDRGGGSDRPYVKREFKPREDRGGSSDRAPRGNDRFGGGQKPFKRYDDKPRDRKPRYEDRNDFSSGPAVEASFDTKQKLKSERSSYGAPSSAFLYGVHAVKEALKNPKRLHQRLLCTQRGYDAVAEAFQEAADDGLNMPQVVYVEKEDIDRLLPRDAVHQDVLLDCQPLEEVFLADILISAPEDAKILMLDQVTDPHNVGAILRSAAAFGAVAVVTQKLHTPDITGTVAKSASGAVEHVPLVREVNLSRALEQLKEAGFFCIGLAEEGKHTLASLKLSGKVVLVLGAEGDGLRRLVAENCDELVKLPTQGDIASLNVSNAAAVALYEVCRK